MRDYAYEVAVNEARAKRGQGPVIHLEDVERAEREEAEERAERETERADRAWLTENSGGHMSQQERLDHPEHA